MRLLVEIAATSGTQRIDCAASTEPPACQLGFAKYELTPPPLALEEVAMSFQTTSPE